MVELSRPRVMLDLLAEHLEDLDFLWEQRERVVFSRNWTRRELADLAAIGEPTARACACDVLAFHHLPPPATFAALLSSATPEVQRLAFNAAGRFGGPWDVRFLEVALRGADRALQRAAFETSARLAAPGIAEVLRRAAARQEVLAPEALIYLGILGTDLKLLLATADDPRLADAALAGLGALGDPAAVPALIERLEDARTSLAAGEAFLRITGATDLEADSPLPPPDDLTEGEADFWDGPRPLDPERTRAWWSGNGVRFAASRRWQIGIDVSNIQRNPELLEGLPLDIRRDLFLSARARNPRYAPDLEPEAHTPAFGAGVSIRSS